MSPTSPPSWPTSLLQRWRRRLAIARAEVGEEAAGVRFAVIAMGKCGGRELNYVSDVDVVYVVEPDPGSTSRRPLAIGDRLAAAVARACSTVTSGGLVVGGGRGAAPGGEGRAR